MSFAIERLEVGHRNTYSESRAIRDSDGNICKHSKQSVC